MGSRALENRIKKLMELEERKAELEKEIEILKDELKEDMEAKGVEELQTGNFIIRWKKFISSRFDSKAFAKEHEALYNQYLKEKESRRFTVA